MIRDRFRPDWPHYLERFHTERPGITEDLLLDCRDDNGRDPYQWLASGVTSGGRVLDLACGSGPMHGLLGPGWIGVDRSAEELDRAVANDAGPVARADALALPMPSHSVDAVVCSMALMLVSPLTRALEEMRRVLVPGGALHVMVPARRPLTAGDTRRYLRLYLALVSPARFPPSPLRRHPTRVLAEAGFSASTIEHRRFDYPLVDPASGRRLVDALYLPGVAAPRLDRASRVAERWIGSALGIALQRIVARRDH
ncbi:MAG: class I SAM-dependent methyltransferase [Acidimicrobiales bacterium]|nr:class I SAM-dependent methyltransferase [Acidimicrobiales bacterium]